MFRPEAGLSRVGRLSGDVAIAVPIRWQGIVYFLVLSLVSLLGFLAFSSYDRVETVTGTVFPDMGVSAVVPTRTGVISALAVVDGQHVSAAAELAYIRTEEDSKYGLSSAAQVQAMISRQNDSLANQMAATRDAADAQLRQQAAQRGGLLAEIEQIQSQLSLQRDLIATAQNDFVRTRIVAERGFIGQRDLQAREEALLARRQVLSQLTQALVGRRAALAEAERGAAHISAQAQAANAGLAASRAQVAQQAASAAGARSYVLRAPVAGTVTALVARVGQPANAQTPLMTIVPTGSKLRAELAVPGNAIGFVQPGQNVRLAIDAFPYQRFGTLTGKILTVAVSPVSAQGANGSAISVYPVVVKLDRATVFAYGREHPLISGMSLSARIVTERQSLLGWLFAPLYAVRRR